ncbi:fumarylacetoacetate hydrolase family protein [Herbaspirillum sp. LeCh32-8]|uniref:fumarylacetoacetate hydrolase family protein n=1 Tax=Herbaspirillum sp. LeCh32-8 TaxID=2821356 RepID=UPI001AEAA8E6|nr:fumarylacetoacetate hydrolase family protein [Herbaspirillum sp. LeCh32-8]MBP0598834.1 fumarylacetoacetate hydrolase family protein [Herbaspirillum sp. LeCh32-8]
MKIATYQLHGERCVGVVSEDGKSVAPFALTKEEARVGALGIIQALAAGGAYPKVVDKDAVLVADVRLEAPIPVPRRNVWCVGRNYHAHAKELSATVFKDNSTKTDEWPIVFTKVPECVVGPFDEVELPTEVSDKIDYEAELAVIIGKQGKNISRGDAMNYVYGYTVVNDVTARDVQIRHQQWDMGKSFDTFCPMGPWLVTADELDGTKSRVRCWVNEELRQDGPVENMIFDIPALIETISRGITLYPGDIIATGTPAGVGMGMSPPVYIKSGDVIRVEIDGLGTIENKFR